MLECIFHFFSNVAFISHFFAEQLFVENSTKLNPESSEQHVVTTVNANTIQIKLFAQQFTVTLRTIIVPALQNKKGKALS